MRCLLLVLCIGYVQALCELPINFTYFQQPTGHFCQAPNLYLESQYGGSFSLDTNGVARETNDPNVRFTIKQLVNWGELIARLGELDPGVAPGVPHTPSLFWDNRQDVFWHADSTEDTISTAFKPTIDGYIAGCLASAANSNATQSASEPHTTRTTTSPPNTTSNDGDGCALDHSWPPSDGSDTFYNKNEKPYGEAIQCFVFFVSQGCPHCATVKDYIEGDLRNANVTFRYEEYDVRNSDYSQHLIAGYKYFGWEGTQGVPTIFIGDGNDMSVLVGEETILEQLLPRIQSLQSDPTACYDFAALSPELADTEIHWGVLTAAALVDSINPCAIAVLLILLGGLIQSVVPTAPPTDQVKPEQPSTSAIPGDDQRDNTAHKEDGTTSQKEQVDGNEQDSETLSDEEKVVHVVGDQVQPEDPSTANEPPDDVGNKNGETSSHKEQTDKNEQDPDTSSDEEMAVSLGGGEEIEGAAPDSSARSTNDTGGAERERRSRSRRAFISGMAFILSVFISYYALGFGIFSAFSLTTVASEILLALGVFIIFLGVWNLKDYFCYEVGYNVEIPRSWRPLLKRVLGAVTSPVGAFFAGFLVCLFELPCTGGPYLFILGLLADRNTRTEAAFLLLYYNFIFVLPLIIINCLVFFSVSMLEKVGSWKEKYIRHLHLVAGLVLIALGALAIADSRVGLFP